MNNPKLVFDIGMHTCEDTEFFLSLGHRVVAVEANPEMCRAAEARLKSFIESGHLKVLNIGISRSPGLMKFFVNAKKSEYSSFNHEIASRETDSVHETSVLTRTLADVMMEFGVPYYCKIDIEGYDHIAIESLKDSYCRPAYLSIENGFSRDLHTLKSLGYRRFQFINQRYISGSRITEPREKAITSTIPDWTFPRGSSGPFGLDLPEMWLAADQVLPEIESYWTLSTSDRLRIGWFDLHAAL